MCVHALTRTVSLFYASSNRTMTTSLTQGSLLRLLHQTDKEASDNDSFQPVLQVTQIKSVGQGRFRTVLSDGTHFVQGMLATQLNDLAKEGTLRDNCVIRLRRFMKNYVQNRLIVVMLDAEIIDHPPHRIGHPTDIEKVRSSAAPAQAPTPQPLYNSTNNNPAQDVKPQPVTPGPPRSNLGSPGNNPYAHHHQQQQQPPTTDCTLRSHRRPPHYSHCRTRHLHQPLDHQSSTHRQVRHSHLVQCQGRRLPL